MSVCAGQSRSSVSGTLPFLLSPVVSMSRVRALSTHGLAGAPDVMVFRGDGAKNQMPTQYMVLGHVAATKNYDAESL